MDSKKLKDYAINFLQTYGYRISETSEPNAFTFYRSSPMYKDEVLIYFHTKGEEEGLDSTLTKVAKENRNIPGGEKEQGRRIFLSNQPLGALPDAVKENGFKYQVPVWFFDREFSTEKRTTPLRKLEKDLEKSKHIEEKRIEQPFTSTGSWGEDLLEEFSNELMKEDQPCIRIVLAPAGYGKTVFTSALYNRLNKKFKRSKQKQRMGKRPLLMLPGHIRRGSQVDHLIDNFIKDEFGREFVVVNRETFDFWIRKNMVIWLLDGTEELILKTSEDFLNVLLDQYLLHPKATTPQIIITMRKPLLVTAPGLQEIIREWEADGVVKTYELASWEDKEYKTFFEENLDSSSRKQALLSQINKSKSLQNLCQVPFYCKCLLDLENQGEIQEFKDEVELMEHSLDQICEREFGKGLDSQIWNVERQKSLFSDLVLPSSKDTEISLEDLEVCAQTFMSEIRPNLAEEVRERQIDSIKRHALLSIREDKISFDHEITKHLLQGIGILEKGKTKGEEKRLNNYFYTYFDNLEIEFGSFLFKHLTKYGHQWNWNDILNRINPAQDSLEDRKRIFRNLINLYLSLSSGQDEEKLKFYLIGKDLRGLAFQNLNLSGFHFEGSELTNVRFENCVLEGANFDRCIFKDTFIDKKTNLKNISYLNANLSSIHTESKNYLTKNGIEEFLEERSGLPAPEHLPCQAGIDLRKILKRIWKKGSNYKMHRRSLHNVRCGVRIAVVDILSDLIGENYLKENNDDFLWIDPLYFDAIGDFINYWRCTPSLMSILDGICQEEDECVHVYPE